MSTTDTIRAAFELWAAEKFPLVTLTRGNGGGYTKSGVQMRWESWQAATEAAKATGTAGELSEDAILNLAKAHGFTTTQILSRGPELIGGSVELHERFMKFGQACAEAARQPAPALPERVRELECVIADLTRECKDLRVLAATAAPVLSDERIDWLANCACPGGIAYPSQVKAAIRDALREASINRSQL